MHEWKNLEDAIERGDWSSVRTLAKTACEEWKSARAFAEALTGSDASALDAVLVELAAAADAEPVDAARVKAAMAELRSLVPG